MNKVDEIIKANICGDGYDADVRAEKIKKAVIKETIDMVLRKRFPIKTRIAINDWRECIEYKDIISVYEQMTKK